MGVGSYWTTLMKKRRRINFTIFYRDNTTDERVLQEQFGRDIYFSGMPEYRPQKNDTVIDVGAHIGAFSLIAASRVPNGKVYSIEASRESFYYLHLNVRVNEFHNLSVHHLALANQRGTVLLYHSLGGNWGHTITKDVSGKSEAVPADTLANFMAERNITRCDFMKMNCEGAEFPIVLGTPNDTLRRIRILLILYHCDLVDGQDESSLIEKLHRCGFCTDVRNKSSRRGWIIARNRAFGMRRDELVQYSLWRVGAKIGGRRALGLFSMIVNSIEKRNRKVRQIAVQPPVFRSDDGDSG